MKNALVLLLFLFLSLSGAAQHLLKGRVVDVVTGEPLEFVSVFINTTTRGTTTDQKGAFELLLPAGKVEVVVSYVGYEPILYQLDADKVPPSVLFKIQPKEYNLGQVVVKAARDKNWYSNLEVFKGYFLGKSEFGSSCKLLNEDVLHIKFDEQTLELVVTADEPLLIENASLGYKIAYTLVEFRYMPRLSYVAYLGYPRYEHMPGRKGQQQRWEKNRRKAYNGSAMHFVRAARKQQLEEEGFSLLRLYRQPNPHRPTDEAIDAASATYMERVKAAGGIRVELDPADPIAQILGRAKLPKVLEQLDKTPVPYAEYLTRKGDDIWMGASHLFQVVYNREKEELAYVGASKQPGNQTSVISFVKGVVLLEENGSFMGPLDVVLEGYWGWEKLGDMLPLDYQLPLAQ